jgi:D-methionine transport system substrate-binding protein
MRHRLVFQTLLSAVALFALQTQAIHAADNAPHVLRVGFVPGPYADEFREGVEPQLTRKGYTIQYVNFSTGLEANQAVWHGEIAADVMQHSVYLKAYNDRNGTDLVGVVQVPTPPMVALLHAPSFAFRGEARCDVAVPNDPVNLERALKLLQSVGWVRIRENPNPVDVSERDGIANPAGIRIVPLDTAQAPRALEDVDFAAIQGNFAISSGHRLTEALALEQMQSPYVNQVVVKSANRGSQETADIVAAYRSDEFRAAILRNASYKGYHLPDYFPH